REYNRFGECARFPPVSRRPSPCAGIQAVPGKCPALPVRRPWAVLRETTANRRRGPDRTGLQPINIRPPFSARSRKWVRNASEHGSVSPPGYGPVPPFPAGSACRRNNRPRVRGGVGHLVHPVPGPHIVV